MSDPAYRAARRDHIAAAEAPIIATLEAELPQFNDRANVIALIAAFAARKGAGPFIRYHLKPDHIIPDGSLLAVVFEGSPDKFVATTVVTGVEGQDD